MGKSGFADVGYAASSSSLLISFDWVQGKCSSKLSVRPSSSSQKCCRTTLPVLTKTLLRYCLANTSGLHM